MSWQYSRRVQFYETDLMGIVHHSNYVRLCEEARVRWAVDQGIINYQKNETASWLAVIGVEVSYKKPLRFGDEVEIEIQARSQGVRIIFEYRIWCRESSDQPVALARTTHAPIGNDLKPIRLPQQLKTILENCVWTETWL